MFLLIYSSLHEEYISRTPNTNSVNFRLPSQLLVFVLILNDLPSFPLHYRSLLSLYRCLVVILSPVSTISLACVVTVHVYPFTVSIIVQFDFCSATSGLHCLDYCSILSLLGRPPSTHPINVQFCLYFWLYTVSLTVNLRFTLLAHPPTSPITIYVGICSASFSLFLRVSVTVQFCLRLCSVSLSPHQYCHSKSDVTKIIKRCTFTRSWTFKRNYLQGQAQSSGQ